MIFVSKVSSSSFHGSLKEFPPFHGTDFSMDDLFTNGENHRGKTPPVNLRSPLPRVHYYQNKRLQVKENPSTLYQPTVEPLHQYPIRLLI